MGFGSPGFHSAPPHPPPHHLAWGFWWLSLLVWKRGEDHRQPSPQPGEAETSDVTHRRALSGWPVTVRCYRQCAAHAGAQRATVRLGLDNGGTDFALTTTNSNLVNLVWMSEVHSPKGPWLSVLCCHDSYSCK